MTARVRSADWRASILDRFSPDIAQASRLTVVSDPDALLTEPAVIERIRALGFEILTFEDHVLFRHAFEQRFRSRWDRGETTHLVVTIRTESADLDSVPYDLLEEARATGRVFSFSLVDIFPKLAPHVIAELDRRHFDALFLAQAQQVTVPLGLNATRDFVLRNVFRIAPELISTPTDLLRMLLHHHYAGVQLPDQLSDRLIERLSQSRHWQAWPLERIVRDRAVFFDFLGERWPHFLIGQGFTAIPGREPGSPLIPGPLDLPFGDPAIRVYMNDLFAEGALEPTAVIDPGSVSESWCRIGIVGNRTDDAEIRLEQNLKGLTDRIPSADASPAEWFALARRWAEAIHLRHLAEPGLDEGLQQTMDRLHDHVEDRFAEWMLGRFSLIHSLPPLPTPVTVDKIPRYLALRRTRPDAADKTALIVVDGMAMDQWLVLRESLDEFRLDERAAFAWVPTLTSVSRQAIFSGEPPFNFSASIRHTSAEERLWARFWDNQGVRGRRVAYLRHGVREDDATLRDRVREAADHPQCEVIGIVIAKIDRMLHGAVNGTSQLHTDVRHWARWGHFRDLVRDLLDRGFQVHVTSDHGNIESRGIGKPQRGSVPEVRGERVFVFDSPDIRAEVQEEFEGTIVWPGVALPEGFLALLPPGRTAFIGEGQRTIGHGGISLEEVIVPFIEISEA